MKKEREWEGKGRTWKVREGKESERDPGRLLGVVMP